MDKNSLRQPSEKENLPTYASSGSTPPFQKVAKVRGLKLISDEEISKAKCSIFNLPCDGWNALPVDRAIAQAQLDADNLKLKGILVQVKSEIEKYSDIDKNRWHDPRRIFIERNWQSFWEKLGV